MPRRKPLRVLCLHGKQQTVDVFRDKISKLTTHCRRLGEFHFLEAPFELPLQQQGDALRMRSWTTPSTEDVHASSGTGGRCAAPAASSSCWDVAVQCVRDFLEEHPCDVLLGFSQGCCVIVELQLRQLLPSRVKGIVFAGAPYVTSSSSTLTASKSVLPSLHIVGEQDTITPLSLSLKLAHELFSDDGGLLTVYRHPHAHSVPQNMTLCQEVESFLEGLRDLSVEEEIARELEEEIEMLQIMFGDDVSVERMPKKTKTPSAPSSSSSSSMWHTMSGNRCLMRIRVRCELSRSDDYACCVVHVVVPSAYPDEVPDVQWEQLPELLDGQRRWMAEAVSELLSDMEAVTGGPMLAQLIMNARDKIDCRYRTVADGGGGGGEGSAGEKDDVRKADWWTLEDEDNREESILAAQRRAHEMLLVGQRGGSSSSSADTSGAPSSSSSSSMWNITIGLIGKPSAGKSTFFNATTDPQHPSKAAKVAAFPFTTILPNIAPGLYPAPCPCRMLNLTSSSNPADENTTTTSGGNGDDDECAPEFGHVIVGDTLCRRLPVLIKDVAGLVKGAYQGRGKGNQFLNDLCDADVLVHVVDGAAATDADGAECKPGEGSALEDVTWVRGEIHSWIYDNVLSKWQQIARRPDRLPGMFSGYQAPQALVDHVLARCGVRTPKELHLKVPLWQREDVHLLVAVFVAMRFPIVTALNKADMPTFASMYAKLRARYPEEVFIPMSAKAECDLLNLRNARDIVYASGSNSFRWLRGEGIGGGGDTATDDHHQQTAAAAAKVLSTPLLQGVGTGVQNVLLHAVRSCSPLYVFPVDDLRQLQHPANRLVRCLTLRRGANVEAAFKAFVRATAVHASTTFHDVKLVRFEWSSGEPSAPVKVLRRDEALPMSPGGGPAFVSVFLNKRI